MKSRQTITVNQSEYASMKQEVERLRLQAEQVLAERVVMQAKVEQLEAENALLHQALEEERARLRKVIKEFVARRSERYKAKEVGEEQINQFAEQLLEASQSPQAQKIKAQRQPKSATPKGKHPGRHPLPEDLPRIDFIIEPQEDVSACVKIGEEITEELDYMPGYFFVRRFIRPKYARPEQAGVAIAPVPMRVIPKGIPGPMLVAYILVCKFVDHLPLYRQLEIFKRSGIQISGATMNGWVTQAIQLLSVLYSRIRDELLSGNYLMADETTIKVLDQDKVGATHLGYYWAYMDPVKRTALFIYEKGRAGAYVRAHLSEFQGYLQTDAYVAYGSVPKAGQSVCLLGCWAHVRRKFVDALDTEQEAAQWFIEQIQRLYAIERFCSLMDLSAQERLDMRQYAGPILEGIKDRMLTIQSGLTPKSVLNNAIRYALNQWDQLMVYTTDGMLEIDNNLVENSIRPIALGRKNYLFAGNHEAAQRSAIIYSIMASCKALQINPLAYLDDVLDKLPTRNVNNIDDLLPWNWTPGNNAAEVYNM